MYFTRGCVHGRSYLSSGFDYSFLYILVSPPSKPVSLLLYAIFHGSYKIIHYPNLYPIVASPCGVGGLRENSVHNDGTGSSWKGAVLPFPGHKGHGWVLQDFILSACHWSIATALLSLQIEWQRCVIPYQRGNRRVRRKIIHI